MDLSRSMQAVVEHVRHTLLSKNRFEVVFILSEWAHFHVFHSSLCLNCRLTHMMWKLVSTWVISYWWRLRRRNIGCRMTGTAGTSLSRPHVEIMWNFPVSVGWWTTRKWFCGMDEVFTYLSVFKKTLPHSSAEALILPLHLF